MRNIPYYNIVRTCSLCVVVCLALTACSDVWDSHYDPDGSKSASDKTLWQELSARPELSAFCEAVRAAGYEERLNGDQMLTVFAPQGTIDAEGLSAERIALEVVENHVARFAFSAPSKGGGEENILLLNGKRAQLLDEGDGFSFAGERLTERNLLCKNGVLHIIEHQVPFFNNIWEYMSKFPQYSRVCSYLYGFDEYVLDEANSVPGAVVDGQITYVDSVTVNYNEMLYRIGRLNDEDSTYYMVLPTDTAWKKAYRTVSNYFNYKQTNASRDSLQEVHTQQAMVNDLVFSATMQHSPADSIVSTTKNVFYHPFSTILAGYSSFDDGVECSNGRVFPVDSIRIQPCESWHSELKLEGEEVRGREYSSSEVYKRTLNSGSTYYSSISNASYLEASPTSASANPNVTFTVPNTLSARYDVKVVFLPQTLSTDKENVGKPNNVQCTLYYTDTNGKSANSKSGTLNPDPERVDTLLLFKDFAFPTCEYGEDEPSVKLKIASSVSSKQRSSYSRTLLIDCVILEPVNDTEE